MGKPNDQLDNQVESELINRIKQGDHQAFSRLIVMYQKSVFRLAMGFFHDRDDAQEIVQETFLRIHEKIGSFDEKTRFRNWMYRIALNLCVDYYRKFKKKPAKIKQDYQIILDQNTGHNQEPEECFDILRFKERLQKSLYRLPKRQKSIFVLKHYGQYRYREIADILNISIGCVKSLHHRSINKLKKELSYTR
jgi:RNA polymerase sigma-70 factor (ECF subfamily)